MKITVIFVHKNTYSPTSCNIKSLTFQKNHTIKCNHKEAGMLEAEELSDGQNLKQVEMH